MPDTLPGRLLIIPSPPVFSRPPCSDSGSALHLSKSSCLVSLLLCPRRHAGHLVGRGQAAVEAAPFCPRGVVRVLIGFCRTAAGPVWFWTGDSYSMTGPPLSVVLTVANLSPNPLLLCICPSLLLVPRSTQPFHIPAVGPTGTSGALGTKQRLAFYCSDFSFL